MLRKIIIPIVVAALAAPVISCNSDNETEYEYTESASVLVSGFYLRSDKKVLDSLENVFFAIDLENARIFNADSLPYGTNVKRIVPSITTPAEAHEVTLKFYDDIDGRDSLVNYLTNSTDSINFANGPVILTVVSESGAVKREYTINVNVHQVKSDTLAWYQLESTQLNTTIPSPTSQGFAIVDGKFHWMLSDGNNHVLATTSTPDNPQWQVNELTLPFTPSTESLRYSDNAAYMLDTEGNLMSTTDFANWTATGQTWDYIIGGYEDQIIGTRKEGDIYRICLYPSNHSVVAPIDFPVLNASVPAYFRPRMAATGEIVIIGGRKADNTLSNDAWGYDGENWVNLTSTKLPIALEDITLVPYQFLQLPPSTWTPRMYPVLMAMGGRADDGGVNRKVYYSRDWGVTWKAAPSTVQLPAEVPAFYGASAFTYTSTMHVASRTDLWQPVQLAKLPPQCSYIFPTQCESRAVAPITEWECPAIYLIGGKSPDNELYTTMWRGVILEYTFVPVQ